MIVGRDCNCEDFPCCGHGIESTEIWSESRNMDYDEPMFLDSDEEF